MPLDGAWKYTHALGLTALNTGAASVNLCHPNSEIWQFRCSGPPAPGRRREGLDLDTAGHGHGPQQAQLLESASSQRHRPTELLHELVLHRCWPTVPACSWALKPTTLFTLSFHFLFTFLSLSFHFLLRPSTARACPGEPKWCDDRLPASGAAGNLGVVAVASRRLDRKTTTPPAALRGTFCRLTAPGSTRLTAQYWD